MKQLKKLVLHFDLNKTIILADSHYPQQTKEECLQEILVGYAWGKLEQRDEKSPVLWKLLTNNFTPIRPAEDMISYKEYICQQFPLKTEGDPLDIKEYNTSAMYVKIIFREQRKQLYFQFVKLGQPCMKLKPEYDRIVKLITLPKAVIEELKQQAEEFGFLTEEDIKSRSLSQLLADRDMLNNIFADNKYQLLPNFYKTIINLKKQKREFAIVFRPFGTDPKNILREFNKFCIGEHPCFSGRNNTPIVKFDGSKGTKNYIVLDKQCGLVYRSQKQLVTGTLRRTDKPQLEDGYEKELEEEQVQIYNETQMLLKVMESLKESCGLCYVDDYQYYAPNPVEQQAKQLYVDQQDADTLHIFFDDGIQENENNLVQVIDCVTLEPLSKKKCLNKYLVHVDILDVIKDPDYFIKQIDLCEKSRNEEIERIEKGIPEEQTEVPKKTEWELLEESSDADYLRKTILPLLLPALQLVDIERPKDPLEFIAMYCLKNKDMVKIPQAPEQQE